MLEDKLKTILEEFGVDKLSDVLDSEEGGVPFEELFKAAVLSPEDAEARAIKLAEEIRKRADEACTGSRTLGAIQTLNADDAKQVANHQLPYWTERMILSYLRAHKEDGTGVEANDGRYWLRWPDGTEHEDAVFSRQEADTAGGTLVTVEDKRVRRLLANLPHVAPQMAIPSVVVEGVSDKVSGWWSLWRIALQSEDERELRLIPFFVDDGERVLAPTARTVWDALIDGRFECSASVSPNDAATHERLRLVASERGEQLFRELATRHRQRLERERKKTGEAFRIRHKALRHVGLDAVRQYRERQLDQEESRWNERLARREQTLPELSLVCVVRVTKA